MGFMNDWWNRNKFTVYDSEELTVLKMVNKMLGFFDTYSIELDNKTNLDGDHKGSWQGINRPTQSNEGLSSTVEQLIDETIPGINSQLEQNKNEEKCLTYNSSIIFKQNVDFSSKYFRIPFGCVTKSGVIVVGCDVRYQGSNDHSYIELGIARSLDGGKTWQDKKIAMRNNNVNPNYSRVMDGTILYDEDRNRIYLLGNYWNNGTGNWTYSNTHKDSDWDIKLCYSDDEGLNWSVPVSLRELCPTSVSQFIGGVGSGIKTSNGTLIFPIQLAKLNDNPFNAQSGIMYSTDGINWTISESYVPAYTSECNVFEYRGEIYINCRQEGSNKRAIYKTSNLGATWTYCPVSENTPQPNACMGSTIKIYTDDNLEDLILFSCVNTSTRGNLTLKVLNFNDTKFNNIVNYYNKNSDGYSCLVYDKWNKKLYSVFETLGDLQFTDLTPSLQNCYLEKCKELNNIEKIPYKSTIQTFYISSNGNDNIADGNISRPFATTTALLNYAQKICCNEIRISVLDNITTDFKLYDYKGKINVINHNPDEKCTISKLHIKNCGWVSFDKHNQCNLEVSTPYNERIGVAFEYSNVYFSGIDLTYSDNVIANYFLNSANVFLSENNTTSGQVFCQLGRNSTLACSNAKIGKNMDWVISDNTQNNFSYNVLPTDGSGILPMGNKVFNTSLITTWTDYNATNVTYNRIFEIPYTNSKLTKPSIGSLRPSIKNSTIYFNGGMILDGTLSNEEVILTVPEFMKPRYYKMITGILLNSDNTNSKPILCVLSGDGTLKIYGTVNSSQYNKIYFDTSYTIY